MCSLPKKDSLTLLEEKLASITESLSRITEERDTKKTLSLRERLEQSEKQRALLEERLKDCYFHLIYFRHLIDQSP